ncbi:hypothetical protein [Pseudomonas donghuensis]|uniref:hypothetical protein n=1 Tax=Pseudomonas donghuensis TaxID=1163398 RepID=UPI00398E99CB
MTIAAAVCLVGKEQRDNPAGYADGADKRSASAFNLELVQDLGHLRFIEEVQVIEQVGCCSLTTSLTSRVISGFGKTIALGGVYSDTDSTVTRSVPFFGQIPGLKWLFSNTSTVSTQTELVLFLTPHLIGVNL